MEGIVTGIRLSHNPLENSYTILFPDKVVVTENKLVLKINEKVNAKLDVAGTATPSEYEKLVEKHIKRIMKKPKFQENNAELKKITKKMLSELKKASKELIKHIVTGAPIVFRFHDDCDGSSGAIALYKAVSKLNDEANNITWRMNKGVGYTTEALYTDKSFFDSFSSIEKPMIFVTDFGTSEESHDALKLCEGKFDLLFIDHHPVFPKFLKKEIGIYINPWDFGGGSDYTAGYLSCILSEMVFPNDTQLLREASLIGDTSIYRDKDNEKAHKIAITLDYLTSTRETSPKSMEQIIDDKSTLDETFAHAHSLLNEAVELGMKKAKKFKTKSGISVYSLNYKYVANPDFDYPRPGRYSSWLQNRLEHILGKNVISIVYHSSYASVRANKEIAKELNLIGIAEELKNSTDFVYSYGGHAPAFSIKSDKQHIEEVVRLFLSSLGAS